jgi:hypothetical protein
MRASILPLENSLLYFAYQSYCGPASALIAFILFKHPRLEVVSSKEVKKKKEDYYLLLQKQSSKNSFFFIGFTTYHFTTSSHLRFLSAFCHS